MECRNRVAEGNCVAVRGGGEQPEANRQAEGAQIRFGVNPWRTRGMMVKPGTTEGAETTDKATFGWIAWLGTEWREGKADKRRDPSCGVRAAGVRAFIEPIPFDRRTERGAGSKTVPMGREAGSWMREVWSDANALPTLPLG